MASPQSKGNIVSLFRCPPCTSDACRATFRRLPGIRIQVVAGHFSDACFSDAGQALEFRCSPGTFDGRRASEISAGHLNSGARRAPQMQTGNLPPSRCQPGNSGARRAPWMPAEHLSDVRRAYEFRYPPGTSDARRALPFKCSPGTSDARQRISEIRSPLGT